MLNIEKKLDGKTLTVALEGRLDTTTAPQLETELKAALDGADSLILDFEKMMSKKGGMKILHVSDVIMEIFEVTGFIDILTIEA